MVQKWIRIRCIKEKDYNYGETVWYVIYKSGFVMYKREFATYRKENLYIFMEYGKCYNMASLV